MQLSGVLAVLGVLSVLIPVECSGTVYVRTGGNLTGCMPCLHPDDSLELYRECGGMDKEGLLMILCHSNSSKRSNPRILLDTSSQCWTLPDGGRNDSCLYRIHYLSAGIPDHMTDIRVLDPVLISNITSNGSRLGEDMAVSVQFFGEKSAVTWEVDGEPLPERYRLIDDNRTLIIPSVQRDDADRRFWVRITNPVSEEIREFQLESRGYEPYGRNRGVTAGIVVGDVLVIMGAIYLILLKCSRNVIPETTTLSGKPYGSVPTIPEHESVPLRDEPVTVIVQNGSVPTIPEHESVPLSLRDEPVTVIVQNGSVPATAPG